MPTSSLNQRGLNPCSPYLRFSRYVDTEPYKVVLSVLGLSGFILAAVQRAVAELLLQLLGAYAFYVCRHHFSSCLFILPSMPLMS